MVDCICPDITDCNSEKVKQKHAWLTVCNRARFSGRVQRRLDPDEDFFVARVLVVEIQDRLIAKSNY